jgi:hypothetical protein
MLTFEFSEPQTKPCECCEGVSTLLTRYVYNDGEAFAVYYASFTPTHPERIVKVAIGLGQWGEGAPRDKRTAFAVDLRPKGDAFEVSITDLAASPFNTVSVLGKMIDREPAKKHPLVGGVFEITDRIVVEDLPIRKYLDGT